MSCKAEDNKRLKVVFATILAVLSIHYLILTANVVSSPRFGGDFATYFYPAAKALLRGENPYLAVPGYFYPPPSLALWIPFTLMDVQTASVLWFIQLALMTGASAYILILAIKSVKKQLEMSDLTLTSLMLFSTNSLHDNFVNSQVDVLIMLIALLSFLALLNRSDVLAGALLALAASIKYWTLPLLVYFMWRKRWKLAFSGVLTLLTIFLISVGFMGWHIYESYLHSITKHFLNPYLNKPYYQLISSIILMASLIYLTCLRPCVDTCIEYALVIATSLLLSPLFALANRHMVVLAPFLVILFMGRNLGLKTSLLFSGVYLLYATTPSMLGLWMQYIVPLLSIWLFLAIYYWLLQKDYMASSCR